MVENKARMHFEKGLTFFHKGEYESALTYFKEAIMEEPQYSEALYNLSCCCSMTGDKESALMYLQRSAKLNPHCMDWANEDHEFDAIREDEIFQRIISGEQVKTPKEEDPQEEETFEPLDTNHLETLSNEDVVPPSTEETSEPPPKLDSGPLPPPRPQQEENYPPCKRCDGLVSAEKRSRFNPLFMLITAFVGVLLSILMFVSWFGLIGIAIIAFGLYLFSRVDEIWVCQNCGATGSDCGQPSEES